MHFVATVSLLAASFGTLVSAGSLGAQQSLTSSGIQRTFFVYTPTQPAPAAGLMVYLHGGGGNGSSSANAGTDFLWQKLADRVGVITLFPEGKPYTTDPTSKTWNDCSDDIRPRAHCDTCTDWDDVQFMRDLVKWATATYAGLNSKRVYMAGESRGSMMAQRVALEAPDLVAAIASVAGNVPVSNDNSASGAYKCAGYDAPYANAASSVPILLFKGDADPRIPFGNTTGTDHDYYAINSDWCHRPAYGASCPPTPGTVCENGCMHSFFDSLAFWEWKHRLTPNRQKRVPATTSVHYADTVPDCTNSCTACDGSYVLRHNIGTAPYPVALDRAVGGGHHFPGPVADTPGCRIEQSLGWKNRDALSSATGQPYIAEEIWAFVTQFTR